MVGLLDYVRWVVGLDGFVVGGDCGGGLGGGGGGGWGVVGGVVEGWICGGLGYVGLGR